MKRDLDLVRKILEYVEREQEDEPVNLPELEGHTETEVYQHVTMCQERGYLKLAHRQPVDNRPWPGNRHTGIAQLTWEGHNALDEMRSQSAEPKLGP